MDKSENNLFFSSNELYKKLILIFLFNALIWFTFYHDTFFIDRYYFSLEIISKMLIGTLMFTILAYIFRKIIDSKKNKSFLFLSVIVLTSLAIYIFSIIEPLEQGYFPYWILLASTGVVFLIPILLNIFFISPKRKNNLIIKILIGILFIGNLWAVVHNIIRY